MSKQLPQLRILVVEDEENNRLVAVKLLEMVGVLAENIYQMPGDPLAFMQTESLHDLDLILLDLQLPDKDGYEILQELRNNDDFAHILVVAMTANVMRNDIEKVQAAGFDGFIGKPINGPRFGEWLTRILAGEKVWAAV